MLTLTITIVPAGRGRYDAYADDRYLVTSRVPFLDAARVLEAQGVDSETPIALRHAGSSIIAMRSTVGAAAGLTVRDDDSGVRFVAYRPFSTVPAPAANATRPDVSALSHQGATL